MTESEVLDLTPTECTLPTSQRPLRLAEFDDVFSNHVRSVRMGDPTAIRMVLEPGSGVASKVADLAARETGCCSFYTFTLTIGSEELAWDIHAAPAHTEVMKALASRARQLSAARP